MSSQIHQALDLAQFLTEEKADHHLLNLETTITPCILAIPGNVQCNLRVVFGVGAGTGATGIHDNLPRNNFLALNGEFEKDISASNVMALPSTAITTTQTFKLPSRATFKKARLADQTKSTSWFKKEDELTESHKLPNLMPISAFLVMDALDKDIDVLVVCIS